MTIKDVASKTGLSVGTISRVMNNRGYISDNTRRRVEEAMKDMHYKPNELARSLIKQRNNAIGVIVPHIEHPYFAKLIAHIETAAEEAGQKVLLCNSHFSKEREMEYIEMCRSNRVTGVILCCPTVKVDKLKEINLPIITIERPENTVTSGIECDNFDGGRLAAEHLIECGCKNVLYLSGIDEERLPYEPREAGFMEVCEKHNISFRAEKHTSREYLELDYEDWVRGVLKQNGDADGLCTGINADGIFASNDMLAAFVLKICAEMGIKVPGDIKVIGFDDALIPGLLTPSLTSIRQPIKEMAEMAVAFVEKCRDGGVVPVRTVLPVTLVKRESTRIVAEQ